MKKTDIDMLQEVETEVVDNSFDRMGLPARFRNIILGAFFAAGLGLGLYAFGASLGLITAAFVAYVAISTLEKVSYVRTQMNSRAVIRKLVHRIESLEGVPPTPENSKPSALVNQSDESDGQQAAQKGELSL